MISIVVPIYNVEKYLRRCLNSIQHQTYSNFEVLLINDGSTDGSESIAKSFTDDSRFRLICKENGGQGQARNVGIDKAKGEYICFIDSDDYIEAEYLSVLYDLLISRNADISQCGVNRVWENGRAQPYSYTGLSSNEFTDIKAYIMHSSFVAWNKLYKKSLFEGMRFPEGIKFEDFALMPQIYIKAKKIVSTDKILYNYLWRNNSITTQSFLQPDILRAYNVLKNTEFGCNNMDIMEAFYIRQIIGSMLWGMIRDKKNIAEVRAILDSGLQQYPSLLNSVINSNLGRVKIFWAKQMLNGHYSLARTVERLYRKGYGILRYIYHKVNLI